MKKHFYEKTGDTLYHSILENGLTVYYLPKADYNRTYGLFTTNFGSLDTHFIAPGKEKESIFPEGIAHFLEHKLFEKEDGDVMYKFGALGAQTNAFTSFTRTSYLFSTRENIYECVELLLDFVQVPYFTDENVEKEQGIIQQEIQMYQDDSDWRLFAGLLERMYPQTPLAEDIAGTPSTINAITADDLYLNYETFYHPSNMNLFLTGPFDVEKMNQFVLDNQSGKEFESHVPIKRIDVKPTEPVTGQKIELEVAMPKLALGFRGDDDLPENSQALMSYKAAIQFLLDLIFGRTSQLYEDLYNENLIDDSFGFSFDLDKRFHFITLTGDTKNPEKLSQVLQDTLKSYKIDNDFNEEHLKLIKKEMLGEYFSSLNSLEYIANQFSSELFDQINFFDLPEIVSSLTLEDIAKNAEKFIQQMKIVEFTVLPKN
ncbi:EF-P 5-aminopentanol modification-associated protein YfmH [Lactococcus fujiensis]|uniref:M16 family peptidase n=1 Tax=Lactococcus fujiensis JCM 16395 TaxID=1291764 RepID=A0A2A5RN57_9LACT|nr:pitrilysin family protein [Lactococcus fujiensis]PCS00738.1 M16 family peptidase [Lactococcus fujiensis JCM 16395]